MARTALGTNDFRSPSIGLPTFTLSVTYTGSVATSIWTPAVANRPAIIVLHGGGWDSGSRLDVSYAAVAAQFAERGFAVFNADYTLTGGDPQAPIDDVLALVSWVRTNAATYNADSTRVAIVGISAGAHLGVMAGITGTTGTSRPNAVVGWSLPADLEEAYDQGNGPETLGVGGYINVALSGNEATYRLYSPVDQITSACCPLRIVGSDTEDTGVGDPGLAVVQYTSMATAAAAAGVSVTSRTFTGSLHGVFTGTEYPTLGSSAGANDIPGTCQWLRNTLGEIVPASSRTASASRTVSASRVAA